MPRVLYFSLVRERVGRSEEEINYEGTVEGLKRILVEKYPHLSEILKNSRFAVNEEYVADDHPVSGKDRVAVIPPVSGG
jgi:molybdopterin synthase sulfur carrier subunit